MHKTIQKYSVSLSMLLVFFTSGVLAQENLSFKQIDSLSYYHYMNKNYAELFKVGEEAIKQNTDYFYLRMRLGIAYYQKHQYRLASKHFKQALEFNTGDSLAIEYLYYSYKFTNNDVLATKCLQHSTSPKAHDLKKKQGILKNIYLFYAMRFYDTGHIKETLFSDFETEMESYPKPIVTAEDTTKYYYTELSLPHKYSNIQVGATLRILPFWQVGIAYQSFNVDHHYTIVNYKDTLLSNPDKWEGEYLTANSVNNIKVSQFYLKHAFGISNKFELSVFTNYQYYTSTNTYDVDYINDSSFETSNVLLGASLTFKQSYYQLYIGANTLNSNNKDTLQSDFGIGIFPFANNQLVLGLMGTFIHHNKNTQNSWIFIPSIAYSPIERLTLFGSASWGKRNNGQTNNGYVIYNGLFDINSSYKLSANTRIYRNLYFKLEYEYLNTTSYSLSKLPEIEKITEIDFVTHSIIGGLIWEF